MKTNHTPGPWKYAGGMVYKAKSPTDFDVEVTGIPIARADREAGNGTFGAERDANCRLIAASPELLESLGSLLDLIDHNFSETVDNPIQSESDYIAAREAIAKATT